MKSDSNIQQESPQQPPQGEGVQQFLDDNFSDVMRSSTIGSNVSSLLNTTTVTTAQNEQKIMLDWVLPDGKNSWLEMLTNKHIADFPAPGGNTGVMLIKLPDLEPFYNTSKFLVDTQSGEKFVTLQGNWHPAGLTCKKRVFEVEQLMILIQHASSKLKNKLYRRKEEQTTVLTLDPSQPPPLSFILDTTNYMIQDKPMSLAMRKDYIKDRAQAWI